MLNLIIAAFTKWDRAMFNINVVVWLKLKKQQANRLEEPTALNK